jgi:hypothetical protein
MCKDKSKEMIQKGDIDCLSDIDAKSVNVEKSKDFSLNNFVGKDFSSLDITANKVTVTDFKTPLLIPNNETRTLYVNIFPKYRLIRF